MTKILVPIDYSESSLAALKHAASLALGPDGQLLILHVTPPQPSMVPEARDEQDLLRHDDVLPLLEEFSRKTPPIRYELRSVSGVPVSIIVQTAIEENVNLIIMGTTGRTGFKRALLGSVAEDVVRRAPCPVLTLKVPHRGTIDPMGDIFLDQWAKGGKTTDATPSSGVHPENSDNPTFALISRAIAARASDVHLDPDGGEYVVRFRIDGEVQQYCHLSEQVGHALTVQLKLTANLDIADPFHAQEGRIQLPDSLRDYDVRVTAVRVVDGEALSLRILNRHRLMRPMEQLGLSPDSQARIARILKHGEGLILVTGPTGSGKTTTLYSMLNALNDGTRNIVSIEDPVEYHIPAFRQLPVDTRHGTTMTSGLKTMLRLDPDVVLVGEIRDVEAAETAMRAASSGKFVFSSLHTRDVASTVTALRDLQIDNRSLAGNLVGIVSQRLIRRVCAECAQWKETTEVEAAIFRNAGLQPPERIRHPVGCPRCRGTGYYDRIGIFEVVVPEDGIIQSIQNGDPEQDVRDAIRSCGVSNLEAEWLKNVALGITSMEECSGTIVIQPEQTPVYETCNI